MNLNVSCISGFDNDRGRMAETVKLPVKSYPASKSISFDDNIAVMLSQSVFM